MGDFSGKVVLVTGGALGIGRGIVQAFARSGASVAIADVNRAAAEALSAELDQDGGTAVVVSGDVSIAADSARMVAEAVTAFGHLDVLVNNAGIMPREWYFRLEDLPEEAWDRILGVNLKGAFLMSKFALPHLRARGAGVVINVSSVQGQQSMPRVSAYGASKAGLLSLTRTLALEYASEGIRVLAICPGTIDSELVRDLARAEGGDEDENVARYGSVHPLGRIGTPSDVGEAALFLASERAAFITGEFLNVDGGFMARGAWASSAGGDS